MKKEYNKPIITEEEIKLEDICTQSLNNDGQLNAFLGDESFGRG